MIGTLALALQLAVATPPAALLVKTATGEVRIPLVQTNAGPALRPEPLAEALGGDVRRGSEGRIVLTLNGAELELVEQVPFVLIDGQVVPLAGGAFVDEGEFYVPLHLVSEVVPRFASGLFFDPVRFELRVFSPDARGATISATGSGRSRAASARTGVGRDAAAEGVTRPVANARPRNGRRARLSRPRLVVIDAGHGGPDNGMTGPLGRGGPRLVEKEVTLAVSHRLAAALRDLGVGVRMTRATDTLIALSDRGRLANQWHADLFVSIHVNAANPRWREPAGARGFETFFLAEAKTEDARHVEQMENEAVRFETGADAGRGDPLSFIINDMARNEHLRESNDLAASIQRSMGRLHPGPDRGVKQANFAVLRTSFMPAVLVEIGFGTNVADAVWLTSAAQQHHLAESLADAIVDYLERYEQRVAPGPSP